jgi:hypothetical protein
VILTQSHCPYGNRWFAKHVAADGKLKIDGNDFLAALGGDKGYYAMKSIGETVIVLTETAAEEAAAADDAQVDAGAAPVDGSAKKKRGRSKQDMVKQFMQNHPNAILDPFFASHRSVVERVFGWLKGECAFLGGPIWQSQSEALVNAILIMCALHNKILASNPNLHVRAVEVVNDGVEAVADVAAAGAQAVAQD